MTQEKGEALVTALSPVPSQFSEEQEAQYC